MVPRSNPVVGLRLNRYDRRVYVSGRYSPIDMGDRTTATSRTIEYETESCIYCGNEVFTDNEVENIDRLPGGVNFVIGGGDHIATEKTSISARGRKYRNPKIIIKWFGKSTEGHVDEQYLCPSCAESVFGYKQDN